MKVNKYWSLDSTNSPHSINSVEDSWGNASKESFDKCTIIHYPTNKNFTPIVFDGWNVESEDSWEIKDFYEGLLIALKTLEDGNSRDCPHLWGIERPKVSGKQQYSYIVWGCRRFTKKKLLLIKETMEWHYGKNKFKGIRVK